MSPFDERPAREQRGELVWNVMSVLLILGMASLVMAFLMIYRDPASPFNPFPPPTEVARLVVPTYTPSLSPTPVTPSPEPSQTPEPSATPRAPTLSPTISATPTETLTPAPTATATINSAYAFILDNTSAISGEIFHANQGCKLWLAGQALDLQRAPNIGITVMLGGSLGGRSLYQLSLTGTALQYGPAGYEFTIADAPAKSTQSAWVMLLDQSGVPLSNKIYFDTFDDCSKNLILVNFKQVR